MKYGNNRTIYIAGPMRGHRYFNFPAFDTAARQLSDLGWTVISPAQMDRDIGFDPETLGSDYDWHDLNACDFSLAYAVDRDVAAIKRSQAIYMLDGWRESTGARAEHALAVWLRLGVFYETPTDADEDILLEAYQITRGDRQSQYGPPDQDFRRTAEMWNGLFGHMLRSGESFTPSNIAQAMILLKVSRQMHQGKRDNWVDIAGYARCGQVCDEAAR